MPRTLAFRLTSVHWVTHALLSCAAVSMMLPFFWMVTSSLKDADEIFAMPPQWIPSTPMWGHYALVFDKYPIVLAYSNSLLIAVPSTVGTLFTTSLAGFAFARLRFSGRNACFVLLLATMMVPHQVTVIPSYLLFKWIGWLDTPLPLIVPGMMTNAFGVFLMRQFFSTIPTDLDDAAKIDGASTFQVCWSILMPLAQPALATLGILTFLWSWNNFLGPLIFLNSPKWITVPLMVASTRSGVGNYMEWWELLAVATLAVLPVLAVYLVGQKYFTEGIAMTGLKGV